MLVTLKYFGICIAKCPLALPGGKVNSALPRNAFLPYTPLISAVDISFGNYLHIDFSPLLDETSAVCPAFDQVKGGQVLYLVLLSGGLVDEELVGRGDDRAVELTRPVAQPVEDDLGLEVGAVADHVEHPLLGHSVVDPRAIIDVDNLNCVRSIACW